MNPLEVSPEYANHALIKFFVSQKTYGFPGSDGSVLSCIMWRILEEHDIICIFFGNPGASLSKLMKIQVLFTGISFNFYVSGVFTYYVCPGFCQGNSRFEFGYSLLVSILQFIYIKVFRAIVELPCVTLADFEKEKKIEESPSFIYIKIFSIVMTIFFAALSMYAFHAGNEISRTLLEEHGYGTLRGFFSSLALSYCFTQPAIDSFMVASRYDFPSRFACFSYSFFHQKSAFKNHFDHFFMETHEKGCHSLSQLGLLAKRNWYASYKRKHGKFPSNEEFLLAYPKYDRKFRIRNHTV